jgi:hypothetical protein
MSLPFLIQFFMFGAGICYVGGTIAYIMNGQLWLGMTFFCYAFSILCLYFVGSK